MRTIYRIEKIISIFIIYTVIYINFGLDPSLAQTFISDRYAGENDGYLLIISSYTYDSKIVSEFLKDFDANSVIYSRKFKVKIEAMEYRGLNNAKTWLDNMNEVLAKHNTPKLKGVILLGQEAWSVYLSIKKRPDVPFFGYSISRMGLLIPEKLDDYQTWEPESVDTKLIADSLGVAGAIMNVYDVEKNIRLIRSFYPETRCIALLTDNTYGGLSIKANFTNTVKNTFQTLETVSLDGRKFTDEKIQEAINNLPQNTVLLLGTWRVDYRGSYFLSSVISQLVAARPEMPIFTLSGTGIESSAIGGYFPKYNHNTIPILDFFSACYNGDNTSDLFTESENEYCFRADNLEKFGLHNYSVPTGSRIIDTSDIQLVKFTHYFALMTVIIVCAVAFLVILFILMIKLRSQNKLIHRHNIELTAAKEYAEKSDKLKTAFLNNISHEIRTPLNAISGFARLMKDADQKQREIYGGIINNNADTLLKLIDGILSYSKIETGSIVFNTKTFDLGACIKKYEESIFPGKNEAVEFKLELPEYDCIVNFDYEQLDKIINHLLDNAFRFTTRGYVLLSYSANESGFEIKVSDSGIGIAFEDTERIFKSFEKINTFMPGAGLGLPYCKSVAEAAGGFISVNSTPGKGSVFTVIIPCQCEIIKSKTKKISSKQTHLNSGRLKILVVEFDQDGFKLLQSMLSEYDITVVEYGIQAEKAVRSDWYDLILIDIRATDFNDYKSVVEIRQYDKTTPIIAMSSTDDQQHRKKASEVNCNGFITKPFTKNQLFELIEKII